MSITDPQSVLLIGAGTSLQFGIPDGNTLFELIRAQIKSELKGENKRIFNIHTNLLLSGDHHKSTFPKIPIVSSLFKSLSEKFAEFTPSLINEKENHSLGMAAELARRLTNQTSETIDDFIFQNPELSEITKIAVAVIIFKKIYEVDADGYCYKLNQLDSRQLKIGTEKVLGHAYHIKDVMERNWVHLLINLVREGIRKGTVSPDNKVKIVTFNYDMVLEYILDKQFANTSASIFSAGKDWREYIEIAHVHGKFDGLNDDVFEPYAMILSWANSLAVIHETECLNDIELEREKAREIIRSSSKIYATGFSFSQSNVELLNIMEPSRKRNGGVTIYYSNYIADYGLKTAMDKYEYPSKRFEPKDGSSYYHFVKTFDSPGSDARPMSTVNWFYSGVPGRLPS